MPKGIPNKRYTGEFKQKVVETMMRDKLSYREAARQFEVPDHKDVAKWERYYLMDGPEGLYIERRPRCIFSFQQLIQCNLILSYHLSP